MYDIYVYDADTGHLIGVDPGYAENVWKAAAQRHHHINGFNVRVVDTTDGAVVYTLG